MFGTILMFAIGIIFIWFWIGVFATIIKETQDNWTVNDWRKLVVIGLTLILSILFGWQLALLVVFGAALLYGWYKEKHINTPTPNMQ